MNLVSVNIIILPISNVFVGDFHSATGITARHVGNGVTEEFRPLKGTEQLSCHRAYAIRIFP